MKRIKVKTDLVNRVSSKYGVTPEEYIAESISISLGRAVCAHYAGIEGEYSLFDIVA